MSKLFEENRVWEFYDADRGIVGQQVIQKFCFQLCNLMKKTFPRAESFKILDPGIGKGKISVPIASVMQKDIEIYGVDNSQKGKELLLERCKKEDIKNIKLILSNIEERIPFKNNFFHGAIIISCLYHLNDWINTLDEVIRVTKPKGIIFLCTFDYSYGSLLAHDRDDEIEANIKGYNNKEYQALKDIYNKYYELRSKKVHTNFPENGFFKPKPMDVSNFSDAAVYLKKKGLDEITFEDLENLSWHYSITLEDIKRQFKEAVFGTYRRGLKEKDWMELGEHINEYIDKKSKSEESLPKIFNIPTYIKISAFQIPEIKEELFSPDTIIPSSTKILNWLLSEEIKERCEVVRKLCRNGYKYNEVMEKLGLDLKDEELTDYEKRKNKLIPYIVDKLLFFNLFGKFFVYGILNYYSFYNNQWITPSYYFPVNLINTKFAKLLGEWYFKSDVLKFSELILENNIKWYKFTFIVREELVEADSLFYVDESKQNVIVSVPKYIFQGIGDLKNRLNELILNGHNISEEINKFIKISYNYDGKAFVNLFEIFVNELKLKKIIRNDYKLPNWENILSGFLFILISSQKDWRVCYYLPAFLSKDFPAGSVVVFYSKELPESKIGFMATVINRIFTLPGMIESEEKILKESLRAGVAAIISRNMSHNIGSHVLANLVQEGWNTDDMKKFLKYMQQRMDFVAHVSTSSPSWCLGSSFEDLIKGFADNPCLLNNIAKFQQLELQHIEIEFRIWKNEVPQTSIGSKVWRWKGGKWKVIQEGNVVSLNVDIAHGNVGMHAFYSILENLLRNSARYGNRVWLECIKNKAERIAPGADATIIPKLKFTIDVYENWDDSRNKWQDDFYKIVIKDHLPTSKKQEVKENGNGVEKETKDMIQGYLDEAIIDEQTGELKQKQWGMKEIKVTASYLRLVRHEEMDNKYREWRDGKGNKPPVIQVDWCKTWREKQEVEENGQRVEKEVDLGELTYTLYLFKPKEALIVSTSMRRQVRGSEDSFRRQGIEFMTEFRELRSKVDSGEVVRHNFLVLQGDHLQIEDWIWLSDHLSQLPYRVVVVGELDKNIRPEVMEKIRETSVELIDSLPTGDAKDMSAKLWKSWVNWNWGQFKICVRWGYETWHNEIAEVMKRGEDLPLNSQRGANYLSFDHKIDKQEETELYKQSAYHQAILGGQPMAILLGKSWQEKDERLLYQFKEAAAVSVAILDERIFGQGNTEAKSCEGIDKYNSNEAREIKALWQERRVDILDIERAIKDFPSFVKNLPLSKRLLTLQSSFVYDFFVIHQGLIDEARKLGNTGSRNFEEGWQLLMKAVRWIIIDTGRGKPDRAKEENLRWIEYSNLAEYIINKVDKYGLMRMLFALQAETKRPK